MITSKLCNYQSISKFRNLSSHKECLIEQFKRYTNEKNFVNAVDCIQRASNSEEKQKAVLTAFPRYLEAARKASESDKQQEFVSMSGHREFWSYRNVANLIRSLPPSKEKTALIKEHEKELVTEGGIMDFGPEEIPEFGGGSIFERLIMQEFGKKAISNCINLIEMGSKDKEEEDSLFSRLIERIIKEGVSWNPCKDKKTYVPLTERELAKQPLSYGHVTQILDHVPEEHRKQKLRKVADDAFRAKGEEKYVGCFAPSKPSEASTVPSPVEPVSNILSGVFSKK